MDNVGPLAFSDITCQTDLGFKDALEHEPERYMKLSSEVNWQRNQINPVGFQFCC